MSERKPTGTDGPDERQPFEMRLPGFRANEAIGLGDTLKRVSAAAGIRPCGGCARRAAALNKRVIFTGRPAKSGRGQS